MNKKDTKMSKLEKEIKKHKLCLKEKDERLTKIEERFNFFKKVITGIFIVITLIALICLPIYFGLEHTETFMTFLIWFGIFAFITALSTIALFLVISWNDEEYITNLFIAFIISSTISLLLTVIIAMQISCIGV